MVNEKMSDKTVCADGWIAVIRSLVAFSEIERLFLASRVAIFKASEMWASSCSAPSRVFAGEGDRTSIHLEWKLADCSAVLSFYDHETVPYMAIADRDGLVIEAWPIGDKGGRNES